MKYRDIVIFCGLMLLLALTGALSGCASTPEPQQTPLPTARLTPIPNDGGMLYANTKAADSLAGILAGRMEPAYGILSASLVSMDNLAEAPHFGRMLMQQISSRLSQHGFKMIEARLADAMIINKQGEFMLSREAGTRLAKEYNAYAVLVGLYSRVGNQLYISTRVLRLGDSAVLAAYEYSLPQYLVDQAGVPFSTATAPPAPGMTAAAPSLAPSSAQSAAVQGVAIRPSYTPSPAPKPVAPVAVPVTASAVPCPPEGVAGDDALWERYSKRGQAFAHCDQPAPKRQAATTPPQRRNTNASAKPRGATKPGAATAKPAPAKPAPAMEALFGKDPLCPPGCVPAPKVECPPGCVPAGTTAVSGATTSATPQTASTKESAPSLSAPVQPAPLAATPATAPAPIAAQEEPAQSAAAPATPSPAASQPASSTPSLTPPAQNGTAPAPVPAVGIPAPAASELGQFNQQQPGQ